MYKYFMYKNNLCIKFLTFSLGKFAKTRRCISHKILICILFYFLSRIDESMREYLLANLKLIATLQ